MSGGLPIPDGVYRSESQGSNFQGVFGARVGIELVAIIEKHVSCWIYDQKRKRSKRTGSETFLAQISAEKRCGSDDFGSFGMLAEYPP